MSAGSRLLLLGLRGSGKTTYLAALWHLIESGELPASLKTTILQPNREYLNRIRDIWLRFQEVERTSLRAQETVSLLLEDAKTGIPVNITLPDLSGEALRLQWAMRKATVRYSTFSAESSGLLLFIHSDAVKKTPLIPPKGMGSSSTHKQAEFSTDQEPTSPTQNTKPWSPELSPTQVQLVELLQFVNFLRPIKKPFRIAVVVSAWDLVQDKMLPSSWIEHRLPLLFQYLVSNASSVPFRIYGVSALGGDLTHDLDRLRKESIPARRIRVVENTLDSHHDLTVPLRFLLDLDGVEPSTDQTL